MPEIIILFLIAICFSLLFTPIAIRLAFIFKVLDKPGHRKIHDKPIPLTGGEAVLLSFGISLLLLGNFSREINGILIAGLAFVLFGLLDDIGLKIRARIKIGSHLLFAFAFIYLSGIQLNIFRVEWVNWILTAGFITFMTNSMNMLDGMDGLDAGVAFLSSIFFAILALNTGQTDILLLSLALTGATLGFLRYNFNPASIFLGEAGSTFLGFILAVLAIKLKVYGIWDVALSLHIERLQIVSFVIPLILLGIPIFDTYFVFANRFLHRIKFSQPGKDHSHHRIHLMGFSQRATVITLYAIQVVLGSIALALIRADVQQFFALLTIVGIFFLTFTVFLLRVEVYAQD